MTVPPIFLGSPSCGEWHSTEHTSQSLWLVGAARRTQIPLTAVDDPLKPESINTL